MTKLGQGDVEEILRRGMDYCLSVAFAARRCGILVAGFSSW